MYNYEDEQVQLLFQKSLYRLQPSFSRWSWRPARWWCRKVRFEQVLPLFWREKGAFASSVLPIYIGFSGSDHLARSAKGELDNVSALEILGDVVHASRHRSGYGNIRNVK